MVNDSITAFGAEFSVPAALKGIQPLNEMLISNNPGDQRAITRILKDYVIMSGSDPAAGQYLNGEQQ